MGRMYNVRGWVEPSYEGDATEAFMNSVSAVCSEFEHGPLMKNWKLVREFGCSDYIFFGATSKYANIMVEDVVKHAIASAIDFDGYFECEDEEDEENWTMRIANSIVTKTHLITWREKEPEEDSVVVEPSSAAADIAVAKQLLSEDGKADLKHICSFLEDNLIDHIKILITKDGRASVADPQRIAPRLRSSEAALGLLNDLLASDDEHLRFDAP